MNQAFFYLLTNRAETALLRPSQTPIVGGHFVGENNEYSCLTITQRTTLVRDHPVADHKQPTKPVRGCPCDRQHKTKSRRGLHSYEATPWPIINTPPKPIRGCHATGQQPNQTKPNQTKPLNPVCTTSLFKSTVLYRLLLKN